MNQEGMKRLQAALFKNAKIKQGAALFSKYKEAFHSSYYEDSDPERIGNDILHFEKLSLSHLFNIDFYETEEDNKKALHLRLYQLGAPIPLSDILPILENLGLRTFNEHPYEVKLANTCGCISDFAVTVMTGKDFDIKKIRPIFQEAFIEICLGRTENDALNKLILGAGLSYREIAILRGYSKYLQQSGFRFSQHYIESTVAYHADISKKLVEFFKLRHDPKQKMSKNILLQSEQAIIKSFDEIKVLAEDQIMRQFLYLMKATLRTNYFQKDNGDFKNYISYKLFSKNIPELPLPLPLYEIFVYSPRFDGIHLRTAKVARGGIRWSDRREDLRTEILGLMKTQNVKNAVIVPSGAKGGFVLKNPAVQNIQDEVIECYKIFIRGLLDVTDNIINNVVQHPQDVICFDDEDPYLVVAADKGTGSFSDTANEISAQYNFWLKDAFASGGSSGYNHKKMGITARGAFESVKRHFRWISLNLFHDNFTVAGIGDLGGDVFGNGMVYSDHIKLVAAFNGKEIFIDPNPDPKISYKERLRLFRLQDTSWKSYNPELISKGGGVFNRSSKSIMLNTSIKKLLDIDVDTLTPDELVAAILRAPVDLLYNGGIGTYVKASFEMHDEVGDRANDFCRVNGSELRCRVVCEGGNLGFTQQGRIEYAMNGGLIYTDFIDNSGGVDCSDQEVNIKILLNKAIEDGSLSQKKRDTLLVEMTDEVADIVLNHNYNQALSISLSVMRSTHNTFIYQNYLKDLETSGEINRSVEFLPSDKNILERKANDLGFSAPEIAVLFAYSKIHIKNEILKSDIPEEAYFARFLESAFPKTLRKNFKSYMRTHRLHREIIATQLSNKIVNEMGVTFVYRIQNETGATVSEVIRAYVISSKIYASADIEKMIDSLSPRISVKLQYELLHHIRHLLNLSTRWFLRSPYIKYDIAQTIKHFSTAIQQLEMMVPELVSGNTKDYLQSLVSQFINAGIQKESAMKLATYRALYILLNVTAVATQYKYDLFKIAKVYFDVGTKFNFVWFRDHIVKDKREGHWHNLARLTLRDKIDVLQKLLTIVILQSNKKEKDLKRLIDDWVKAHPRLMIRWEKMLEMLFNSASVDYTMFMIALSELSDWIHGGLE